MEKLLDGKTILITGSSSGIGKALARGLAQYGANIVLNGRSAEKTQSLEQELQESGTKVLSCICDIQDYTQVQKMVEEIKAKFTKIDVLINNAGYSKIKKITRLKPGEFQQIFRTNIEGTYNCTHAVVPLMIENNGGCILNTGSLSVKFAMPAWSAYAMTKAAIMNFTENLATELKQNKITINTIMPNMVDTPLFRQGMTEEDVARIKPMNPEDLVPYYLFFMLKDGQKLSGVNVNVDTVKEAVALIAKQAETDPSQSGWKCIKDVVKESWNSDKYKEAREARKIIDFIFNYKPLD